MTTRPSEDKPRDAAAIPDVAGVVLGWRTWRLGSTGMLLAPLWHGGWPPGEATVAECDKGHRVIVESCGCGLYAVADPRRVPVFGARSVLGVVALWGDVLEGTRGWRASHGYPRLLVVGPDVTADEAALVAGSYRVPVLPSTLWMPELVAELPVPCPPGDAAAVLPSVLHEHAPIGRARLARAEARDRMAAQVELFQAGHRQELGIAAIGMVFGVVPPLGGVLLRSLAWSSTSDLVLWWLGAVLLAAAAFGGGALAASVTFASLDHRSDIVRWTAFGVVGAACVVSAVAPVASGAGSTGLVLAAIGPLVLGAVLRHSVATHPPREPVPP